MSYVRSGFLVLLMAGCGDDAGSPADTDDGTSSSTSPPSTSATTAPPTTDPTTPPTSSSTTVEPETGSTTGDPDPSTTTGSAEGSSTTGPIQGIPVPFRVTNLRDQMPLEDVDVCFLENPSCDVSDDMGAGELIGPIDTNLTFDLQNGGVFPTRYPVRFGMDSLDALLPALTSTDVSLVFLLLGYDEVPVEGTVAISVVDEDGVGLPGATVNIAPPVPNPVYFAADGMPDQSLTATEAGLGIYVEVGAGDYEAWVEHPTRDCVPSEFSWPGTMADRAALSVVDGYVTVTFIFTCSPP